jgi:hypothetical protein
LVRLDQKKSGNPVMGMPFRRQFWKKILLWNTKCNDLHI